MIVFITPLILFIICSYLIKKLIPFLKRKSLVDYPSERRNHSVMVPKGAGIVIIPLLILSLFGIFLLQGFLDKQWLIFIISTISLFVISLFDDMKNLSAPTRLVVHFMCVALSIFILKEDISKFLMSWPILVCRNWGMMVVPIGITSISYKFHIKLGFLALSGHPSYSSGHIRYLILQM